MAARRASLGGPTPTEPGQSAEWWCATRRAAGGGRAASSPLDFPGRSVPPATPSCPGQTGRRRRAALLPEEYACVGWTRGAGGIVAASPSRRARCVSAAG